jgi:hypothetical protein
MSKILLSLTLVCSLLPLRMVSADTTDGQALHKESCIECHMMPDHTAVYTRENRIVDSLHRLGGQVSACTQALNISWFPEEEKAVVDYLNATYYQFDE